MPQATTDTPHRHKHMYSKLWTKCNIYNKNIWHRKIPMINTNKNTLDAKFAPLAALEIFIIENLQCRQWRKPHQTDNACVSMTCLNCIHWLSVGPDKRCFPTPLRVMEINMYWSHQLWFGKPVNQSFVYLFCYITFFGYGKIYNDVYITMYGL